MFVKSQCFTYVLETEAHTCIQRTELYNTEYNSDHFSIVKILILTKFFTQFLFNTVSICIYEANWVGIIFYIVVSKEGYVPPLIEFTY